MTATHCTRVLSIVASLALIGAACGGDPPARSGQSADPVSLSSSTTGAGAVGGDVLANLIEASASATVKIDQPSYEPQGDDYEGDIIAAMQAGKVDISVVRSDRLASAGATSLGVLQTPLLVTSDAHADKIAADLVADDLMSDLDEIGLVGVALVPGGLRHPFGYGTPVVGPDDYRGETFNTRVGDGVDAIFSALGASTDHSIDAARSDKVGAGELRGIDASFQQLRAVDLPAVVTSNVTLYAKFDVVVVRREAWDQLTDPQRDELRAAAVEAGKAAIADRDTEADGLDRWCAMNQAASVIASPEQIEGLRVTLRPAIEAATSAPEVRELVDRLAGLAAGSTAPAGKACGTIGADSETAPQSSTAELSYAVEPTGPQDVLEGVWRADVDRQALIDAGVSSQDAGNNAGVWTFTFDGNIATVDQPKGSPCTWDFAFDGDNVSIDMGAQGNDSCYGHVIGTYARSGDVVTFHFDRNQDYGVELDNAFFQNGMQKIG